MNNEMVKKIEDNIDKSTTCLNDDLNRRITVQVDRGLLEREKKITNELIRIGYNDLFIQLEETLKEAVKYIKKVNLNKPFKKNIIGKILGIELDADYLASTTCLYECLLNMIQILTFFDVLFKQIDEVERDYSNMISNTNFDDITVFNKATLLAQIQGLKQMKLSLLTLYNCYSFVLKNPQIKNFFIKWLEYKKRILCKIDSGRHNQEVEEYNELMISKLNNL